MQTVALSALLFLYKKVLSVDLPYIDNIERARRPKRLPVVFSRSEVQSILTNMGGVHQLMASLLYGSGLRLNECLSLRVKDVDFEYRQITIRDGKGFQDRQTLLPVSAIAPHLLSEAFQSHIHCAVQGMSSHNAARPMVMIVVNAINLIHACATFAIANNPKSLQNRIRHQPPFTFNVAQMIVL
jgi:site-specific recombinase XerD